MVPPNLNIGQRVKHYRRASGRSQVVIAGLCGITERYLQQIEAGRKVPSADVLARLPAELGVPIAALLAEEKPADQRTVPLTAAPAVARALMGYGPVGSSDPGTPVELRERVERAWSSWQTSKGRFTEAAEALPGLIADVEHAVRLARRGNDLAARREVLRVAGDLYGLLRSYCRRAGRLDLSLMVADRAIRAAEDADDPVRIAAAQWNLGHVLLSHSDASAIEVAKDIALVAVEQLRRAPATVERRAVEGSLELVAVVSDARRRNWWAARQRLADRAAPLAKEVGEGNVQWTVFGPTNVHLHAMSIEMLAGEAALGPSLHDTSPVSSTAGEFRRNPAVTNCSNSEGRAVAGAPHSRAACSASATP